MTTQPDVLTVIGASWCPDCRRTKAFLGEHRVAYEWIDLDMNPEAVGIVEELNGGSRTIPTVLFPDGTHLAEPGNDELADKLGLTRVAAEPLYDLIIIGGGPTGLTASIYAARENYSVLIIEKSALGGQAGLRPVATPQRLRDSRHRRHEHPLWRRDVRRRRGPGLRPLR